MHKLPRDKPLRQPISKHPLQAPRPSARDPSSITRWFRPSSPTAGGCFHLLHAPARGFDSSLRLSSRTIPVRLLSALDRGLAIGKVDMIQLACILFRSIGRAPAPRRKRVTVTIVVRNWSPESTASRGTGSRSSPRPVATELPAAPKGFGLAAFPWMAPHPDSVATAALLGWADWAEALPEGTVTCLIPAPECRCIGAPESGCRLPAHPDVQP